MLPYIAYMDPMGYEKCINHSGSGSFGFSDVVKKIKHKNVFPIEFPNGGFAANDTTKCLSYLAASRTNSPTSIHGAAMTLS